MNGWLELPEGERTEIEKELRLLWFLWAANLATLIVLSFLSQILPGHIREDFKQSPDFPLDILKVGFFIVAFFSIIFSFVVRKLFLSGRFKVSTKGGSSAYLSNKPLYLIRYRNAILVSEAAAVSIGIYGFILFLFGESLLTFYLFIIVAAIISIFHRPKRDEIVELLHKEKTKD